MDNIQTDILDTEPFSKNPKRYAWKSAMLALKKDWCEFCGYAHSGKCKKT